MEYFIFCGKNWDWYFSKKNKDSELELFENVELTREYNEEKFIGSNYFGTGSRESDSDRGAGIFHYSADQKVKRTD